jgi:hypothetical protein
LTKRPLKETLESKCVSDFTLFGMTGTFGWSVTFGVSISGTFVWLGAVTSGTEINVQKLNYLLCIELIA